jgi:hypothetical protein
VKSDRTLKRWYQIINKRFFYGELPANVIVRWAVPGEENDIACTERLVGKRHSYEILLNREKNKTNSIKLASLVHEMIHIATHYRDNHGKLFEEWRAKLGERGVFKKGALLRGITLF